jgi:hypothetical protein
MFEKEDCIKQYLFPLQVILIYYFYHLFLFNQNFGVLEPICFYV